METGKQQHHPGSFQAQPLILLLLLFIIIITILLFPLLLLLLHLPFLLLFMIITLYPGPTTNPLPAHLLGCLALHF